MQETNLYTITVPPMIKEMQALKAMLVKATALTESKKNTWMSYESALLTDKLVFDQLDLIHQIQFVSDNAKGCVSRLAEIENPKMEDTEKTFAELQTRLDTTIAFVQSIKPEQIIGKETISVVLPYWGGKHLTGFEYATEYLLPNFYFHATTAFAIMRKNGLNIGKADFMGTLSLKD